MPQQCEVCGQPIYGEPQSVIIEGGALKVCGSCSKLGKPITRKKHVIPNKISFTNQSNRPINIIKDDLELRQDFNKVIRKAREKMGISQEELGRKINEKLSVIKHVESAKLTPDNSLAKKLQHYLKVELLVPDESEL